MSLGAFCFGEVVDFIDALNQSLIKNFKLAVSHFC